MITVAVILAGALAAVVRYLLSRALAQGGMVGGSAQSKCGLGSKKIHDKSFNHRINILANVMRFFLKTEAFVGHQKINSDSGRLSTIKKERTDICRFHSAIR